MVDEAMSLTEHQRNHRNAPTPGMADLMHLSFDTCRHPLIQEYEEGGHDKPSKLNKALEPSASQE